MEDDEERRLWRCRAAISFSLEAKPGRVDIGGIAVLGETGTFMGDSRAEGGEPASEISEGAAGRCS